MRQWKEFDRQDIKDGKNFPFYIYFPNEEVKYKPRLRYTSLYTTFRCGVLYTTLRYIDEVKSSYPEGTVMEVWKGNPNNQATEKTWVSRIVV